MDSREIRGGKMETDQKKKKQQKTQATLSKVWSKEKERNGMVAGGYLRSRDNILFFKVGE